ncbi:MAG: trigger factor [Erysipelothrix sp.]|nr:trigger factor [Erysipelothrix sp.]
MLSTWTKKENSTGTLNVTINEDAWKDAQKRAFKKLAKDVEVPGFRKGKAPEAMVKKAISEQSILMEAVNEALQEMYTFALDQEKVVPIAQPEVAIQSLTANELVVDFNITVSPEVTLAQDYKTLSFKPKQVRVTAKEIDEELEKLQKDYLEWELKEEGEVENGDKIILDYAGYKGEEAFEGGSQENAELEIGSGSFIPGFEEQLIGVKSGESKDLNLTFPQDYPAEELKGADVVFKTTVHEIRKKVLPELNDDFAKLVNEENVTTLDELKASIKARLTETKKAENLNESENLLLDAVVDGATVEIPQVLIDSEAKQMLDEFKQRLSQQGLNYDLYKQLVQQSDEDVFAQITPDATKRVKLRLVLDQVAKQENLEASDEDVEKEYQTISEMYGLELDQIKQMATPEDIAYDVRLKKARESLLEQNK